MKYKDIEQIEEELYRVIDRFDAINERRVIIKALIAIVGDLKVIIHPKDHDNHFHVISTQKNINSTFNVDTLEFIENRADILPSKRIRVIQGYFQSNTDAWNFLKKRYKDLKGDV